jgi:hypothetical protein
MKDRFCDNLLVGDYIIHKMNPYRVVSFTTQKSHS